MAHWCRLARAGADFCVWLFIYIYYELWHSGEGLLRLLLIPVCSYISSYTGYDCCRLDRAGADSCLWLHL